MSKQFLMFCAICALFLVSCEKHTQDYSFRNSKFYSIEKGNYGFYFNHYLEFDKPTMDKVTYSIIPEANPDYDEEQAIPASSTKEGLFQIEGSTIRIDFYNSNIDQTISRYASYHNDTIIFEGMVFSRL